MTTRAIRSLRNNPPTERRLPSNTTWTETPLGAWMRTVHLDPRAVAEACEYTKPFIHQLLSGYRTPSAEALTRISDRLRVPADILIEHVKWVVKTRQQRDA